MNTRDVRDVMVRRIKERLHRQRVLLADAEGRPLPPGAADDLPPDMVDEETARARRRRLQALLDEARRLYAARSDPTAGDVVAALGWLQKAMNGAADEADDQDDGATVRIPMRFLELERWGADDAARVVEKQADRGVFDSLMPRAFRRRA